MPTAAQMVAPGRVLLPIAGLLIAIVVLFGGGGTPSPGAEALVELAALVALAAGVACGWRPLDVLRNDPVMALLVGAILLFPLIQLLPLPPGVWQMLPGRGAALAALAATREGARWQPSSLLPDATLAGALALLPAIVLALSTASLSPPARVRLIGVVAALGVAAALLGIVQFIGGADLVLSPWPDFHRGWSIGFFANRNAHADLLAISLTAGLLLAERLRVRLATPAGAGWVAAGLVTLAGGIATGSRMGLVALAVPVTLAVVQAGRRAPMAALILGLTATLVLVGGTALDRVAARSHDGGGRAEIWGDSLVAAASVAPVGGGIGSFQPLYAAAERLDHVQPTIANRAHNDWLELAIEGGAPALLLLVGVLALVGRRAVAGWRDADPDRRLLARSAGLTALILAVHSTVDYPLRTLTLLSIAALALAGLARIRAAPQEADRSGNQTHAVG